MALAGHNGAGKSTLIKLILGLIRPSAGRVALFGHDAHSPRAAQLRARVGYLPETVALHPSMTGAETLAFYARLKRQPLSANAALLERVGIAAASGRRVGGYSRACASAGAGAGAAGRAASVAAGRTHHRPGPGLAPAVLPHRRRAARGRRTILLSTHALSELAGHADRVVVMKAGRKIADGTLSELRRRTGLPLRIRLTLAGPGSGSGSGSGSGAPLPRPGARWTAAATNACAPRTRRWRRSAPSAPSARTSAIWTSTYRAWTRSTPICWNGRTYERHPRHRRQEIRDGLRNRWVLATSLLLAALALALGLLGSAPPARSRSIR